MTTPIAEAEPVGTGGATVRFDAVDRTFGTGSTAVRALHGVQLEIGAGEFVVLLGPSGSGKTTLLNLAGAIDSPTAGTVTVAGVDVGSLSSDERTAFRRDHVGFVFQFFNLVPTLTALENVVLVGELTGRGDEAGARSVLDSVGMGGLTDAFPASLSGGQQQRVAIARALATAPDLLLADEPTGALDLDTGRQALRVLRDANTSGRTVLLVTHNSAIAGMADRVVRLRDGEVVADDHRTDPLPPEELDW